MRTRRSMIVLAAVLVLTGAAPAAETKGSSDPMAIPVTLRFPDATVREVLETLFHSTGVPFELDACVQGRVSFEIANVDVRTALSALSAKVGLDVAERDGIYQVTCAGKTFEAPVRPPLSAAGGIQAKYTALSEYTARRRVDLRSVKNRDDSLCEKEYAKDLAFCFREAGPPRAVPEGSASRAAADPIPVVCVEAARRLLNTCLDLDGAPGPNAARVSLNGDRQIRAYAPTVDEGDGFEFVVNIEPARAGAWTLHVVNGFPDDAEAKHRCRAAGTINLDSNTLAFANEFNGRPPTFERSFDLTPGEHRFAFLLRKTGACRFAFAAAWLERERR